MDEEGERDTRSRSSMMSVRENRRLLSYPTYGSCVAYYDTLQYYDMIRFLRGREEGER